MEKVTVLSSQTKAFRKSADDYRRLCLLLRAYGVIFVDVFTKRRDANEQELPLVLVGSSIAGGYDVLSFSAEQGKLASLLRSKGYSGPVIGGEGIAVSLESACPVRESETADEKSPIVASMGQSDERVVADVGGREDSHVELNPSNQQNPPASSGEAPPGEVEPALYNDPPPLDNEPPPLDNEPWTIDELPPPFDEEPPPPFEEEPPPFEEELPPFDEEPPPFDEAPPPFDEPSLE